MTTKLYNTGDKVTLTLDRNGEQLIGHLNMLCKRRDPEGDALWVDEDMYFLYDIKETPSIIVDRDQSRLRLEVIN